MWQGQRCFIIGGGESLKDFDWNLLEGERVIAINRAYEFCNPDIIFSMDSGFWKLALHKSLGVTQEEKNRAYEKLKNFTGTKILLTMNGTVLPGISSIITQSTCTWSDSITNGLGIGQNSGYGALNLAVCLGANPVYLLGYDMHGRDGRAAHFHSGYARPQSDKRYKRFADNFRRIAPNLKNRVINLNPDSSLKYFTFGNIKDVFGKEHIAVKPPKPEAIEEPKIQEVIPAIKETREWIVVSFVTENTSYESEVKNLESSLRVLNIPYHIFKYPALGSWRKNLDHKSDCILRAFEMFPEKDIVFLDSDAVVRRRPVLFDELSKRDGYDIAARFRKYKQSLISGSLLSGTLWIRNNPTGHKIVKLWHRIGKDHQEIRHQHCLNIAINEIGVTSVFKLPEQYTYIFDEHGRYKPPDIVIEHFQASRRFRKEVGYGVKLQDSDFGTIGDYYKKDLAE